MHAEKDDSIYFRKPVRKLIDSQPVAFQNEIFVKNKYYKKASRRNFKVWMIFESNYSLTL